jgi:hypothetical protein
MTSAECSAGSASAWRRRDEWTFSQPCLEPLPDPADVIDELWRDPDPDTALWALWVQRKRSPERGEALRRQPRIGLTGSPSIARLLCGEAIEGADLMERLLTVPLVAGWSPAALFNVVRFSKPRRPSRLFTPGPVRPSRRPELVPRLGRMQAQAARPVP